MYIPKAYTMVIQKKKADAKAAEEYRSGLGRNPIESYFTPPSPSKEEGPSGLVTPLSPIRVKLETPQQIKELMSTEFKEPMELCVTVADNLLAHYNEESITDHIARMVTPFVKREGKKILLVGEHSPVGRWHYHGLLEGLSHDAISKLRRTLRRHVGINLVRPIRYEETYYSYLAKAYVNSSEKNAEPFFPEHHIFMKGLKKEGLLSL